MQRSLMDRMGWIGKLARLCQESQANRARSAVSLADMTQVLGIRVPVGDVRLQQSGPTTCLFWILFQKGSRLMMSKTWNCGARPRNRLRDSSTFFFEDVHGFQDRAKLSIGECSKGSDTVLGGAGSEQWPSPSLLLGASSKDWMEAYFSSLLCIPTRMLLACALQLYTYGSWFKTGHALNWLRCARALG